MKIWQKAALAGATVGGLFAGGNALYAELSPQCLEYGTHTTANGDEFRVCTRAEDPSKSDSFEEIAPIVVTVSLATTVGAGIGAAIAGGTTALIVKEE